jgi:hypothetical protein
MAAFMKRLAEFQVGDAATLGGLDATQLSSISVVGRIRDPLTQSSRSLADPPARQGGQTLSRGRLRC